MGRSPSSSLTELAKQQFYEPNTDRSANPIIREQWLAAGELDRSPRGWKSVGPSFMGLGYHPSAPLPRVDRATTLGMHMVDKGLGWEHHNIEYVPFPRGYKDWGIEVLKHHNFHLMGQEDKADFRYGAIYCSLGGYSASPALLRALLETWNSHTNTFLFPCGERTITLLDLHKMAGLPVDGDFYEEYVPPRWELEPSLLLYPNFLLDLLNTWDELAVGDEVKFSTWCDHFYNKEKSPISFSTVREERMFVAAFIALWLCCFVVVGSGPYIRRGVLVMAAWMALGRQFSLAPPALCSLYYSLRLISMHPIGPAYTNRAWPVHFVIGWMGLYLRKVFGNMGKRAHLPVYKHKYSAEKPSMTNTMCRTPDHFSPTGAHDFFHKRTNIAWHPYEFTNLKGIRQLERTFIISIRRGMLPWRRGGSKHDLCIAEPYHPDRVAQQFRFDQVIPFLPLPSLYTMDDVGIAYAYWEHLLRPAQDEEYTIPDSSRSGRFSVAWTEWWVTFIKPFASVWPALRSGNASGRVSYAERKEKYAQHNSHLSTRKICQRDFLVVREVAVECHEQRIAYVTATTEKCKNALMRILRVYLDHKAPQIQMPPLVQPALQPSHNSQQDQAAGSSSTCPLLIDNPSAQERMADNQVNMGCNSGAKRHSSQVNLTQEDETPAAKRKLECADEAVTTDFATDFIPPVNATTIGVEHLATSSAVGYLDLDDFEDDAAAYCIAARDGTCPPSLPFTQPFVDIAGFDGGYVPFPSDIGQAIPSVDGLNDDLVTSFINDFEQPSAVPSGSTGTLVAAATPGMEAIDAIFLDAVDKAVEEALKGLDTMLLRDPARCQLLEDLSNKLPVSISRVLRVKEMLVQLVTLSKHLQLAQGKFERNTKQKELEVSQIMQEQENQATICMNAAQEIKTVNERRLEKEQLVASLAAQLEEATCALNGLKQEEERLGNICTNQADEEKKLNDALSTAKKSLDEAASALQDKLKNLTHDAEGLLIGLKNWRSVPN
ncbi:hypothetical protein ACP70R_045706 [Stipagrostis hirtigluma subsp. patula]